MGQRYEQAWTAAWPSCGLHVAADAKQGCSVRPLCAWGWGAVPAKGLRATSGSGGQTPPRPRPPGGLRSARTGPLVAPAAQASVAPTPSPHAVGSLGSDWFSSESTSAWSTWHLHMRLARSPMGWPWAQVEPLPLQAQLAKTCFCPMPVLELRTESGSSLVFQFFVLQDTDPRCPTRVLMGRGVPAWLLCPPQGHEGGGELSRQAHMCLGLAGLHAPCSP